MDQDRIVYKIDSNNFEEQNNILLNLKVIEYLPIQDTKTNNKLIVNKLSVDDNGKKLFIETSFLKVKSIDSNKLCLELPKNHIDFFYKIDEKCTELLGELVNGNSELDITELYKHVSMNEYDYMENLDIEDIEYKTLINDDSNIIKINIFPNTTVKQFDKNIPISKIKQDDEVRLLIGLDYISLLIDTPNLLARTKIYTYFIDVKKKYTFISQEREKINNWNFTSSNEKQNIFIKTSTTCDDNFDVNTEINNNVELTINDKNNINKLEQIQEINDKNISVDNSEKSSYSLSNDKISNDNNISNDDNLLNNMSNEVNNQDNSELEYKVLSKIIEDKQLNIIEDNIEILKFNDKNNKKQMKKKIIIETNNKSNNENINNEQENDLENNKSKQRNKKIIKDVIKPKKENVKKTRS